MLLSPRSKKLLRWLGNYSIGLFLVSNLYFLGSSTIINLYVRQTARNEPFACTLWRGNKTVEHMYRCRVLNKTTNIDDSIALTYIECPDDYSPLTYYQITRQDYECLARSPYKCFTNYRDFVLCVLIMQMAALAINWYNLGLPMYYDISEANDVKELLIPYISHQIIFCVVDVVVSLWLVHDMSPWPFKEYHVFISFAPVIMSIAAHCLFLPGWSRYVGRIMLVAQRRRNRLMRKAMRAAPVT